MRNFREMLKAKWAEGKFASAASLFKNLRRPEMSIIGMTKEQIENLQLAYLVTDDFKLRLLSGEEVVYIARILGAFWTYDYEALRRGRPGLHAELKSELHSDGFLVSKIMLALANIKVIIAGQMGLKFKQLGLPKPDWVAGIPDGAKDLGRLVASLFGAKEAEIKKQEGRIVLVSDIPAGQTLLLIEDFCTKGTGFKETVREIVAKQPEAEILPVEMVIIKRGGLQEVIVDGFGAFKIVALAEHRIYDWSPEECPLCSVGSRPIKPKASDENWHLITTSQME